MCGHLSLMVFGRIGIVTLMVDFRAIRRRLLPRSIVIVVVLCEDFLTFEDRLTMILFIEMICEAECKSCAYVSPCSFLSVGAIRGVVSTES